MFTPVQVKLTQNKTYFYYSVFQDFPSNCYVTNDIVLVTVFSTSVSIPFPPAKLSKMQVYNSEFFSQKNKNKSQNSTEPIKLNIIIV